MTAQVPAGFDPRYYVDESSPWFGATSGWPDEVPKNIALPRKTLGQLLHERAAETPDDPAMWFLDGFMNWKEVDELTDRFAAGLHKAGLRRGDVIALVVPNCFQYVIAYYAAARLGAIVTGVNPTYKPQEVLHQLKICGVNAIVYLDALYGPMLEPIWDKVHKELSIKFSVTTNIVDLAKMGFLKKFLGKLLKKIPGGKSHPDSLTFKSLVASAPEYPEPAIDVDAPATYIMTGGTTGVPKAAVLSHFNCVSNAIQAKTWLYKTRRGAANVCVLPLFHSFAMTGVMNSSVAVGSWMMLFPRPPETRDLLEKIKQYGPDDGVFYAGAEILFKRIADLDGVEEMGVSGKFALCVSGAGPLHDYVQKAFEQKTGAKLVEGYGLTEASPVVSAGPFWGKRKIGSIGLPFPATDWRIVDMNDAKVQKARVNLDAGEEPNEEKHYGEIAVAGPQVMVGYLNQPAETAETIIEMDGKKWLLTGDIGFMDEGGAVYIRDRKKQLIKMSGYSVYPKEVEELLGGHPAVSEVAVAGIPDARTGEKIKAWIVLKKEYVGKVTIEEILDWSINNMTRYKVPSYLEFIDEIPKNPIGKVLRRVLQENDPLYKSYFAARSGG